MRTFLMRIAFDGTDFHGFQNQPGLRTVQSVMEDQLRRVLRHPLELIGSGRTDAGVHAAAMGTSFTSTTPLPPDKLIHAIGSRLPEDVGLLDIREAAPDFHARKDAICKLYQYRIFNSRTRPVAEFAQRYAFHCWRRLDVERMAEAAKAFIGAHDFTSFAGAGCMRENMVRTILHCHVERQFNEIRINVLGEGFLYQQVRIMAGTLMEVGVGRFSPEDVGRIIASRDRKQAGPTAQPHGLCLRWVRYPVERLVPSAAAAEDSSLWPVSSWDAKAERR
ncbi:MAG: tRNA pseudouridine(38-40) synthase TruA [Phycisphaerales bacterium]|nr:tRNA pseudouridine(38-40) synthase TruA [Phycisphaerales bacterium]